MGADESKIKQLENENRNLNRNVQQKSVEVKLSQRDVEHLNEKLRAKQELTQQKDAEVRACLSTLRQYEYNNSYLRNEVLEKECEIKLLGKHVEIIQEKITKQHDNLKKTEFELNYERRRVKEVQEEKHQQELKAERYKVKAKMMKSEKERQAIAWKEKEEILMQQKKRDDKMISLLGDTVEKMSDIMANQPLCLPASRQRLAITNSSYENRHFTKKRRGQFLQTISLLFCPKAQESSYQEFRLFVNWNEDLDEFLDVIFSQHKLLALEIQPRYRQSYFQALKESNYSVFLLDQEFCNFENMNRSKDVKHFIRNVPESSHHLKFYIFYDKETKTRIHKEMYGVDVECLMGILFLVLLIF